MQARNESLNNAILAGTHEGNRPEIEPWADQATERPIVAYFSSGCAVLKCFEMIIDVNTLPQILGETIWNRVVLLWVHALKHDPFPVPKCKYTQKHVQEEQSSNTNSIAPKKGRKNDNIAMNLLHHHRLPFATFSMTNSQVWNNNNNNNSIFTPVKVSKRFSYAGKNSTLPLLGCIRASTHFLHVNIK